MATLELGNFDRGVAPENWRSYFSRYHEGPPSMRTNAFRGDANGLWCAPKVLAGTSVAELQRGLKGLGFSPQGEVDGIFGYRTLSAVWLFQEYMRTVGGKPELGAPDGLVGKNTRAALESALAANLRCRWTVIGRRQDQPWLALLDAAKRKYEGDYRLILPTLFQRPSDTLPPSEWQTGQVPVHIIGIRRTAWAASLDSAGRRLNNDVFVVIANHRVMRFFGSTDPDPVRSKHSGGAPFLCKGQHNYRFGFHRLSNDGEKCYRALRPAKQGVRVVRDCDRDKKLSSSDRLDPSPSFDINIHWSGRGTTNWSAGCQVVAGALYLNHKGDVVDCWDNSAIKYDNIKGTSGRGAYQVMMSLISVCAPDITTSGRVPYTLIEEDDLKRLAPNLHESTIGAFATAARTVAFHDGSVRRLIAERAPHLLA